ncbi:MAG TPA: flagellar hook-associated protein FlgK [Caulobacteraceae bacterium]|jgi:flagellar hook-associated protein 1 FlgK|nr:flagellar hook-associated protein FlgK [Caulobacteraceae bacterium]
MSINGIMAAATSGLQAAQTGLRTVSDNIANVDTPGYIRKVADQVSTASAGVGSGVTVTQIRLAADRFLQAASLSAGSEQGRAAAASNLWNQAQGLFGDPSEDTSFFSSLDRVFSAFSTLAAAPTSSAARAGALDQASAFFDNAQSIADQLQGLRDQADAGIEAGVQKVNQLLSQIDALNVEISKAKILSNDATAPQNQQSQLIDQLSQLMDIKVSPREQGGVTIRASDGSALAGDGAATLTYQRTGANGELWIQRSGGQPQLLGAGLGGGAIKGMLDMRNSALPDISSQLSELVSQTADQLNLIHNSYSSAPAPTTLSGRNTGLDLPTAVSGFTGKTTVAILDSSGVLQRRVDVDFTAGTLSVDGGAASAFTPATFLASLNGALGAMGSASFANGALSISATGTNGVAIQDDAATPSLKSGRGFSAFFGLNDLVRSGTFSNYDTGLTAADPHGFTAGQQITFRMTGADGSRITDIKVTVPAGGTMGDLLTAMNAPASGVGLYGSFSLDANGQLAFTSPPGSGTQLLVVQDGTQRGAGGPSMSALFGIGEVTRSGRAGTYSVRADIAQDPSKLALAQLNLGAAVGTTSLATGDTRGADALARAGQMAIAFDPAGAVGKVSQKISDYAAGLSGHIARQAEGAQADATAAEAVGAEADARRSSVEGVNLDQELIQLTTYQQAYNASARMIQAAKDMYDVLLNMTN